jgi:hypothetical protein
VGTVTKAESEDGVTSQPPKTGAMVDPSAGLIRLRAVLKTKLCHLWGGADHTELQL